MTPTGGDERMATSGARPVRTPEREPQDARLAERLARITHTVFVLSGKGGVGKSTVAANLAVALARDGYAVGVLDADVHGPSVPQLLSLAGCRPDGDGTDIAPVPGPDGLKVMSIAFLVPGREDAVIWRGPLKMKILRQLLADVNWGELDFLIVDLPPGTGDEPLSICQLIPRATGAVVVTTPQDLAISDVRRCISFCRALELPVLGVLENMSGLLCPHCGEPINVFGRGGGEALAREMAVPFLGCVPMDPTVVPSGDAGTPFVGRDDSRAAAAFRKAVAPIAAMAGQADAAPRETTGQRPAQGRFGQGGKESERVVREEDQ